MTLDDLATPCAVVDRKIVERNTARMSERMTRLGVRLRPHVKTHKCLEAARLQVRGHFGGITVSTLAEAEWFAGGGFRDITYAFPLPLDSLPRIAALSRIVDRLSLVIDNERACRELETLAERERSRFSVFLKVDCGYHRAGVDPGAESSVALARRLARSAQLDFRGILTHAGHSYESRGADDIRRVAHVEREVTVAFAEKLRASGLDVPEVSVGSTPTMSLAEDLRGVTEARPGNYVFYDAFQAAIGSCRLEDVALSVMVSVVGVYPEQSKLLINAGALALSKDPGARHIDPDCGYGVFFSMDGSERCPGLSLYSLSQEHGQIKVWEPSAIEPFGVGTRLRVVPNHSCLTAAMYDRYHVVEGVEVVDEWRPVRGW